MRQADVAFRAGLSTGHYLALERGQVLGLRAVTLFRLCLALNVSANYLLGLVWEEDPGTALRHDHDGGGGTTAPVRGARGGRG